MCREYVYTSDVKFFLKNACEKFSIKRIFKRSIYAVCPRVNHMHSAADARLDEATGQIRPACGQPLASKCRVEPTNLYMEETNTRSTASSNGCVELEVKLIGGLE